MSRVNLISFYASVSGFVLAAGPLTPLGFLPDLVEGEEHVGKTWWKKK